MRIGVLASGSGTILEAIFDADLPVTAVLVDRACRATEVAHRHGVEAVLVERQGYGPDFDRTGYTRQVVEALQAHDIELVVMAGFGTMLAEPIHAAYPARILNTHPSLLPAFKGWHAVEQALVAGVKVTGCTVHLATLEVDEGPILAQEAVRVLPGDTVESLHERIKDVERRLYPATIRAVVDDAALLTASKEAMTMTDTDTFPETKRALLSVYDKTGLVPFAQGLADLGWELVSSGGTSTALADAGLEVLPVESVTGSPEMLGGRVKTLHPKIHGGILADRSKPEHLADLERQGIAAIDLVVCNLYPFVDQPSVEMIDIGGPTMVRAAAKNHDHVAIVVEPGAYGAVLDELRASGEVSLATRRSLARAAFAHTAAYDAAIVGWLDEQGAGAAPGDDATADPLPKTLHLALDRAQDLRYGENPHQVGARYRHTHGSGWWDGAVQHGGKELSYLNLYDTEAAWRLVHSLGDGPAVAVIKHANPCGTAVGDDITEAYQRAHACDPVSAFGGIVAVNRPVPRALAEALAPVFTEVVVAPSFDDDALEVLSAKKNLRILSAPAPTPGALDMRSIDGGLLVQTADRVTFDRDALKVVTKVTPTHEQWRDLELAWRVVARTSSNAIVLVKDGQAVGIGCGQQNRRDAGRLACEKAEGRAAGGAYASDAFFPFPDGLDGAVEAGAATVIQPGGSIRDDEVIAAADEHGLAMVFTGERHFRH